MDRVSRIAAVAVATLLGLWFLLAGAQKFLSRGAFEEMFAEFGLPLWLVPVIGVLEILGALLVLLPRTSLYGASLIAVVMVGAVCSHLLSGVGSPVPPLAALAMAGIVGGIRVRLAWPVPRTADP